MNPFLTRAAALLAAALLLAGCRGDATAVEPPAAVPPVSQPGSVGQGLDIHYLDENGEPQVLQPQDFPRR